MLSSFIGGHQIFLLFVVLFLCWQHSIDTNSFELDQQELNQRADHHYYYYYNSSLDNLSIGTKLERYKRQLNTFVDCPERPAKSRASTTRAEVVFYSPESKKDVRILQRKADWQQEDVSQLIKLGFDVNKATLLYTHGYTQSVSGALWLKEIRARYNELTERNNNDPRYNLMFFDWSDYLQRNYGQTVSYAPYLGKVLASYLEQMSKFYNYSMDRVHIISYSMSTHISGVAGRKLAEKNLPLAQITALDPTGVCFQSDTSTFAQKYSLRPSDAKLVVARHYDMFRLGSRRPVGGLDVFVNNGSDQPAMLPRKINGLQILASAGGFASHTRASEHEAEPFDEQCHEMAYACRSYRSYLNGECGDCGKRNDKCWMVSTLGAIELAAASNNQQNIVTYKPNSKMYLKTGRLAFCLHHYQLVAKLASSNSTRRQVRQAIEKGGFTIRLTNSREVAEVTLKNRASESQYTALLSLDQKIGQFQDELQIQSNYNDRTVREIIQSLKYVDIKYMSNVSAKERLRASMRYCPNKQSGASLVKCP